MRLLSVAASIVLLAFVPPAAASSLSRALELAGANRPELERALEGLARDERDSMEWLIAHMPEGDLATIDARFLKAHLSAALAAWKSAPWSSTVDERLFREAILPYASVSEARELWLPALRERCLPMVKDAKSPGEAAVALNQRIFPEFKVKYSTKRERADQSPSESMKSGLASCTGLSILLVDACRSVGVPARFVGVPVWSDGSGNHSWVEVWDGSRWRFTGAAEPTGDRLDEAWFTARAATQDRTKPEQAIYAVSWRDTGVEFPMVFDRSRPRARAVDVTDRYAGRAPEVPSGSRLVRVLVRDPRSGTRVACRVELRDGRDAIVGAGETKDERFDLNDHLELIVPAGGWQSIVVDGHPATEVKATPARNGDAALIEVSRPLGREESSAVADLREHLADGSIADAPAQRFAREPLTKEDAANARRLLLDAHRREMQGARRTEFDSRTLEADGARMPFWYAVYGDKPIRGSGRALFISMHGGGGAPKEVNDRQWENQKKLYQPEEGVYVAPRAPTDTWNLWHQGHIDPLFRKLIADMIEFEGVDPNRVYLMGYSAGGDGVFQLAPRMADSFAAASMMAGHPNETQPDGLRNLPFAIFMGGKDSAFNRNQIARDWKVKLDELAKLDPGGYPHEVTIHEENGHWMERKDATALPWMARFERNIAPGRIVWLQDDVTSTRFYWLGNPAPRAGARVVVDLVGQEVAIREARGIDRLAIRLDDSMIDLSKPVRVTYAGRGLFEGQVQRTIEALARTLVEREDPAGMWAAEVTVDLPPEPQPEPAPEPPANPQPR